MRAFVNSFDIFALGFLLVAIGSTGAALSASPPPLEVYGALPKTEDVDLSPDGTKIALVGSENDSRLILVQTIGGEVLLRARIGDLKLKGVQWAGNDDVIVYVHQTDRLFGNQKREDDEGIVYSLKDHNIRPLMRPSGDYLSAIFNVYGVAEINGHPMVYVGLVPTERSRPTANSPGFFKQSFPDLYRVDIDTGRPERVAQGNARTRNWVVDGAGNVVVESEWEAYSGEWKVFRPGQDDHPLASGKSPFGFSLNGLSRTPASVLVKQGGDVGDVVELHLDTGQTEVFLPAGKTPQYIRSRSTGLLLGVILATDNDTIMFDPTLDRHWKSILKAFNGQGIRLASVSDDLSRMLVYVTGKQTPGTWQLVDFTTGRTNAIAEAYPDIPATMIGPVQLFGYRAADGLSLQAVLTLPPGLPPRNLPLVVLPHGGPEDHDGIGFNWWSQAFASRGYAVVQPNFRGSSGYGIPFRNAGFGQWGRKMQTDISDGVSFLARKGIVDPRRVCILGASYGGYAALAGVTIQHGLYRCAASYGGVSDMHEILAGIKDKYRGDTRHYADTTMRYWQSYLGVESADDPILDTIAPRALAKNADAPILLIYGEKDTVVPPDQSKDMASALKRAGKPVELVELDGEDHWLSRSATRLQMLKAMMAFVEKYNPADPAPGK